MIDLPCRWLNSRLLQGAGQRQSRLYMVTELMKLGSVFRLIRTQAKPALAVRLKLMLDGALGLQYLHSLTPKVIHR